MPVAGGGVQRGVAIEPSDRVPAVADEAADFVDLPKRGGDVQVEILDRAGGSRPRSARCGTPPADSV